jgi:hypothetical protein
MPSTLSRDAELRLPPGLILRAVREMDEHGRIFMHTAAELIEHGADMHRLNNQIEEQYADIEADEARTAFFGQ